MKTGGLISPPRGRVVISSDGKTMTATGTDADGKAMAVTLVYDKQ